MKIDKLLSQHRRDFIADYVCEHCGCKIKRSGYDDHYFHSQIIPAMKCPKCGKVAPEEYQPITPKYPDGHIV